MIVSSDTGTGDHDDTDVIQSTEDTSTLPASERLTKDRTISVGSRAWSVAEISGRGELPGGPDRTLPFSDALPFCLFAFSGLPICSKAW